MTAQQIPDGTVRAHFEALFRPQQLRFKVENTIKKYRIELDRLDRFLDSSAADHIRREPGPARLNDLTDVIVGDAAEWLLKRGRKQRGGRNPALVDVTNGARIRNGGLSVESTRAFIYRICKIWDFLARLRLTEQFPTLANLRRVKRVPKAWSEKELRILHQALTRLRGDVCGIAAGDWFASFITVMWRSGERPKALLSVTWDELTFRHSEGFVFLSIPGEKRKGGRQPRVYRLGTDCIEWLDRIRRPARELVWPWPFRYDRLFVRYKEILRCAGLAHDRNSMFSRIRCSHGSHLEARGGDATESLGHSSRQVTVDHYLDETIVRREWPADRLFRLDDGDDGPRAA